MFKIHHGWIGEGNLKHRNFPPETDPPSAAAKAMADKSADKVGRARRPLVRHSALRDGGCRAVWGSAAYPEGSPYRSEAETVAALGLIKARYASTAPG